MMSRKQLTGLREQKLSDLLLQLFYSWFPRILINDDCQTERSAMAVDLAYRSPMDRITVAGQRLILTDFAFQPPLRENRHHCRISLLNYNYS